MQAQLRRAARRVLNAASIIREPLYSPPGHFYSPLSSEADAKSARGQLPALAVLDGVDLRAAQQLELAEQLGPLWSGFADSWRRYTPANGMYGLADGAVYYSVLTSFRPGRVIEVGSGYSSAAAIDLREQQLPDLQLTFIEPYPDRLLGLLEQADHTSTTLHRKPVQDVPLEVYDDLDDGDILFIDSTHVSKAGSDVNWLFFTVLPRLKPGVIVHVHDIFFPFEYPDRWLAQRRSWNETYLLRAFLSFNACFDIMFFNSWMWRECPDVVARFLPASAQDRPGGIWLRRTSAG